MPVAFDFACDALMTADVAGPGFEAFSLAKSSGFDVLEAFADLEDVAVAVFATVIVVAVAVAAALESSFAVAVPAVLEALSAAVVQAAFAVVEDYVDGLGASIEELAGSSELLAFEVEQQPLDFD